ncbi:MAG: iron-containing alcohol dehydrogenase [Lachnospiraceae bacterium]
MDFNYYLPVNLVFGRGKVDQLGSITETYGTKALIVTGRNSTKKSGLLDRSIALLAAAGVESVVFDQVQQNPLTTTAIEGAECAKAHACDVVIGLGGGSIMDCAKAVAFLAVNEGDINDYIFNVKKSDKALPIILVPTTCGTGSEGNGFAVLTNPGTNDKKSLRCNAIIPKASIIDSELMETMPKSILATVGFDALCHNMEAYMSNIAQPMTDIMSVYALQLIGDSLVALYKGEATEELWDKLTLGSTLGGMVINIAGVTVAHGMEHPASGLKDIVHGKGLAALTPVIMTKTVETAKEKCSVISKAIGGTDYTDCVAKINEMLADLDLTITLGEQGITAEDIPWMVENFFKVSAAGLANHPVLFTKEDIADIFALAL